MSCLSKPFPMLIAQEKGELAAVLMSLEDCASHEETRICFAAAEIPSVCPKPFRSSMLVREKTTRKVIRNLVRKGPAISSH